MEEVKQIKEKQEEMWSNNQRFQSQFRQEQERLAREIQEVRKSQSPTLANNKRLETEKNLQQAMEKQGRDIAEMRKQLTLWTRNTSAREAYTCWAHQQANPNLSEIAITQISDHSNSGPNVTQCRKRKTNVLWVPQIRLWGKHFLPTRSTRASAIADCTSDSRKNEERKLEEQETENLEHSGQSPHAWAWSPMPRRPKP
ncbi:hypothetical protein PIB30_082932 [Stylosanthes scabra]|uniref:Uncharacterized protein n=1 Tax=Stylosanthes scabra TaxID=79078 RepID=A0ABU6VQL7_9FABA|nr:hypothetical protein [Stylosanthes scabra]